MLNEEVRNVMTKDPVVVSPEESVEEVARIMVESRSMQIPVVKDKQFLGVITSRDLWKNNKTSKDPGAKMAKDIMTTRVIQITPKDKLGTAAELFMDKRFKTLPVVNLRNELKGVITAFDIIRYTLKKEYKQTILYKDVIEG
jgi:CBS domain-containing protein